MARKISIRDLCWLMVVLALAIAWYREHSFLAGAITKYKWQAERVDNSIKVRRESIVQFAKEASRQDSRDLVNALLDPDWDVYETAKAALERIASKQPQISSNSYETQRYRCTAYWCCWYAEQLEKGEAVNRNWNTEPFSDDGW